MHDFHMLVFIYAILTTCLANEATNLEEFLKPQQKNVKPFLQEWNSINQNISVKVGGNLSLGCPISADPAPIIWWIKGSSRIEFGKRITQRGRYLEFVHLRRNDSGFYTCVAANPFGQFELKYFLNITERRRNANHLKHGQLLEKHHVLETKVVTVGTNVTFKCPRIKVKKKSEVNWFANNSWISTNKKRQWRIILKDVRVMDSGNYTCVVSNTKKKVFTYMPLTVVGKVCNQENYIVNNSATDMQNETMSHTIKIMKLIPQLINVKSNSSDTLMIIVSPVVFAIIVLILLCVKCYMFRRETAEHVKSLNEINQCSEDQKGVEAKIGTRDVKRCLQRHSSTLLMKVATNSYRKQLSPV